MIRRFRWTTRPAAIWVGGTMLCTTMLGTTMLGTTMLGTTMLGTTMLGTSGPAGAATTWREEPVSGDWITANSLAQAGDQVWASAFTITPTGFESRMLHRVHGRWTSVAVPDIGRLGQVSAGSADDVWALSQDSNKVLHFTGSSWQVAQPATDASVYYSGITQFGTDVWLAGSRTASDTTSAGVVQHWDGHRWSDVALPEVAPNWVVSQITGTSGHDLWAIGTAFTSMTDQQTVALHYDGSTWRRVGSPTGPDRTFVVLAAKAFGRNDVWMAGTAGSAEDGPNHPFAAVFDGHRWTEQKIDGDDVRLTGVTRSGNRVLVVGYGLTSPSSPFGATETAGTNDWSAAALPATPAGSPGYNLSDALTLRDRSVLLLGSADKPDAGPRGDVTWRPYAANGRL